jgi:hypothetical protein
MALAHNAAAAMPPLGSYADIPVAGPGSSKATIPKVVADFTTVLAVNTGFDSVLLPPAIEGMSSVVANKGGTTLGVQTTGSDTVNGGASDTIAAASGQGVACIYICVKRGQWFSLRSS